MSDIDKVLEHYGLDVNSQNKMCCPLPEHTTDKTGSFTVYPEDDTWYCFGCSAGGDLIQLVREMEPDLKFKDAVAKVEEIIGESLSDKPKNTKDTKKPEEPDPMPVSAIKEFLSDKVFQDVCYRGITKETDEFYRVRSKLDENGKVIARYYPETFEGKLVGFSCRNHPKDFTHGHVGKVGSSNDMDGQFKYKSGGKYILIVGGQEDKNSAHQMFLSNQRKRGQSQYNPIAVVAPNKGEGSCAKQVSRNYDFFDSFENIIVGLDNDDAGIKAAKEVAKVLPKDKVKVAKWSMKDPNEMLKAGKEDQFLRDFWSAKDFTQSNIKSSINLLHESIEYLSLPRISLPPYMNKLQQGCGGGSDSGILQCSVVNIIADTSVGKTTHVNNMVHHFFMNSPIKPGAVEVEMPAGPYLLDLISLHLGDNLMNSGRTNTQVMEYIQRPEVYERYKDLLFRDTGEERFKIIDNMDGGIDRIVDQMECMYKRDGVRLFVIDVLSDLLRSCDNSKQDEFMMWEKEFVKKNAMVFNVLHTRKVPADAKGNKRRITEYDALGSSTFPQSAHINILMERDKLAEDFITKNTTFVWMPKVRGGTTGEYGGWTYDVPTRRCYDYDDYMQMQTNSACADVDYELDGKEEDNGIPFDI